MQEPTRAMCVAGGTQAEDPEQYMLFVLRNEVVACGQCIIPPAGFYALRSGQQGQRTLIKRLVLMRVQGQRLRQQPGRPHAMRMGVARPIACIAPCSLLMAEYAAHHTFFRPVIGKYRELAHGVIAESALQAFNQASGVFRIRARVGNSSVFGAACSVI